MRDKDVRLALRALLESTHSDCNDTRIVEEMGVWSGSCRIDVAVINGELAGYELKSDSDTLERLPAQAAMYERVFDRVTLVAGARHVEKAVRLIPAWWGVIVAVEIAEHDVHLEERRPAKKNSRLEPVTVAQLLWRDEALAILEDRGMAKGWRSKPAAAVHRHLAHSLSLEDLTAAVREGLKARQNWLGQAVRD